MSSVDFDVANAMVEGIENNFKGKSYKKVVFLPFCDTILMLKYVESIEIEHLFVYKPRFLGSKRLAFFSII